MRRSLLFAAALAAGIVPAGAAELTGRIKSIDAVKGSITLTDGMTFVLPVSIKATDLTVGEKVRVTYAIAAKANAASRIVDAK